MILKVLLLSDIHGNYAALKSVLEQRPGHDLLVCLGDYLWTSLGNEPIVGWVNRSEEEGAVLLKGNSDSMEYYNRYGHLSLRDPKSEYAVLQHLQGRATLEIEGHRMLAIHDYPKSEEFSLAYRGRADLSPWVNPSYISGIFDLKGIQLFLFGGIHLPYVGVTDDLLLVNPGGIGFNSDGDPRASYMLLDIGRGGIVVEHMRAEYDIDKAVDDVVKAHSDPSLGIERGGNVQEIHRGRQSKAISMEKELGENPMD